MKKSKIRRLIASLMTVAVIASGSAFVVAGAGRQVNAASMSYTAKAGYTGWKHIGGYWYYYENGKMIKGWKKVNGYWYYMDTRGRMQTGWWQNYGGDWYYFGEDGSMKTGWQKIGGLWYYLKDSGIMATGWQKINGYWYFLESSGEMKTGWKYYNGEWYYLFEHTSKSHYPVGSIGLLDYNAICGYTEDKYVYTVIPEGAMVANRFCWINGSWYCFDMDGIMITGLVKVDGAWRFFGEKGDGRMRIGGTHTYRGITFNVISVFGHCVPDGWGDAGSVNQDYNVPEIRYTGT